MIPCSVMYAGRSNTGLERQARNIHDAPWLRPKVLAILRPSLLPLLDAKSADSHPGSTLSEGMQNWQKQGGFP